MIYDILYNDCGEYIAISPMEMPLKIELIIEGEAHIPEQIACGHRHTIVSSWAGLPYYPTLTVRVNGTQRTVTVSRYPDFTGKVLMSTLVLQEEKWIKQWIAFHATLGVDHFIVYDNSGNSTLRDFLKDDISSGLVVYIPWGYPYRLPRSGISGQTTQQNHSIYTWRKAAYIGLLDVDEYINLKGDGSIRSHLDAVVAGNENRVGGVELVSRIFRAPEELLTHAGSTDFFRATLCTEYIFVARQKVFVIPRNVQIFSVHMIVKGLPKRTADPDKSMCFHHYWFLSRSPRGEVSTPCVDTSMVEYAGCTKFDRALPNRQPK